MATITTRVQGDSPKGSPLTNAEVDNNFINLNTAKYESGDSISISGFTQTSTGNTIAYFTTSDTSAVVQLDLGPTADPDKGRLRYEVANDKLALYTGNTERMFVTSAASVFNEHGTDTDFRVESDNNSSMLFVDAGGDAVGIATNAPLSKFNQTSSYRWFDTTSTFVTVDGGDKEANIILQATGDENHHQVGGLWFTNKNGQADAHRQIAGVSARTVGGNTIAGGDLQIWTKISNAGSTVPITTFRHDGVLINEKGAIFNESGANSDFRVESDTNSNMFMVDASLNRVLINSGGGQSTSDSFTVEGASSLNGFRVINGGAWASWGANTDYYICTMNPANNGSSAAANIEIFATGGNVSASFRVVSKNASGTTSPYAYCTGTNTAALQIVAYRDNSDASVIHFYIRPTSGIAYTPRATVTGHGALIYDPNAPSAPVDDDWVWGSSSSYTRRVQSGTGLDVSSAYDTTIHLSDLRTANPASTKYKSLIGWSHYHGRSLTFGMEHNDYSISGRRALLKFNASTSDVEGYERLTVTNSQTVFNEESQDYDFRVESDANAHAIFLDSSTDKVGFFSSAPGARVQISGESLGSTAGDTKEHLRVRGARHHLTFEEVRTANQSDWNSTDYNLQVRVDTTKHQGIKFISDANYARHVDFHTGGDSFMMRLDHNGRVGVQTNAPQTTLDVNGQISTRIGTNGNYSTGILEITSGASNPQIKITTNIPYSGSGASTHAHTVKISGFNYGTGETANVQISWHVYSGQFYNRTASSSGGFAPTITLAVENNKVVIHLGNVGYWPKLYVESMYNAYGGPGHARGWTWSDSAINADAGTPNQTVAYKTDFGGGNEIGTSGAIFNETGANQDFRIESDYDANAFKVDADTSNVNVGGNGTTRFTVGTTAHDSYPTNRVYMIAGAGGDVTLKLGGYGGTHVFQQFLYAGNNDVGRIYGTSSGISFQTTSDRRLKENIEDITDGTEKLMAMRPVTHTWVKDKDHPAVHGFIAQEMQEVVPEAVSGTPDSEEMMAMDYGRITPVLVAALQDAHKKIAELETRLNELEGK